MTAKSYDPNVLAALLSHEPSAGAWDALCEQLAQPAWDKAADQWLPDAQTALDARWPDSLRVWPHGWLKRKVAPRATALVRRLALGSQNAKVHEAIFAQLATLDAATTPALAELALIDTHYKPKDLLDALITGPQSDVLFDVIDRCALRKLTLRGGDSPEVWRRLRSSPAARSIRELDVLLGFNRHLSAEEHDAQLALLLGQIEALGSATIEPAPSKRISASDALIDALATGHAASLQRLTLHALRDEAQAERLARASWPALRAISVAGAPATLDAVARLLDAAPALEELSLSRVTGAARSPSAPHAALQRLVIFSGVGSLAALLAASSLPALRHLVVHHTPLDDADIDALFALPALESLAIAPQPAQLLRMAQRPLPALTQLTLNQCDALPALAALQLPALRTLTAHVERLDDAGVDALAAAPWLAQLERPIIQCRLGVQHPKYSHLWGRLNALGVSPLLT